LKRVLYSQKSEREVADNPCQLNRSMQHHLIDHFFL
jgi:hypothetical protein